MKIKILLTLAATLLTFCAAGAIDFGALRHEADNSRTTVTSPGAPCNRDGEKFSEFIVRFTTDAEFAASRTRLGRMFALPSNADYRAKVITEGHEAGYIQWWQIVDNGKVKLSCRLGDGPTDYSYIFVRGDDGNWMLTDRITEDF